MSRQNSVRTLHVVSCIVACVAAWCVPAARAAEPELLGHWPLTSDSRDHSPHQHPTQAHGVRFVDGAATFDGLDDWLETNGDAFQKLGKDDFTIALWFSTPKELNDVPGDLLQLYDARQRRGVQLSLKTHEVTTSRVQSRTLHFGIDNNRIEKEWTDHGRVGNAVLVFAMAVYKNQLYVGTCEPGAKDTGRVYRWGGGDRWIDCQIPAQANSVCSLAVVDGQLYAGTGKYRLAGSALPESENPALGGRIFRYGADGKWVDCGQLPDTEAVSGITSFRGHLYAGSLYRPAGFFRHDGEQTWTRLETPNGKRVEALCVYNGQLFASSYDEAHVYRYDGTGWVDCGQVGDATNTQTYSFAVYGGKLYVGTWRSGKVFRYDGDQQWIDCGQLGQELEVMGMLVHNGRLLAGSLPLAGVFQYDGGTQWRDLGRVDLTPDVTYRRAWTMAEFGGRVLVGTLPSGRVLSNAVGVNATYDAEVTAGWHHVAARRTGGRLQLFLDGKQVAASNEFRAGDYDLSVAGPLRIGLGANDHFAGQLRDVRFYRGSLGDEAIEKIARP